MTRGLSEPDLGDPRRRAALDAIAGGYCGRCPAPRWPRTRPSALSDVAIDYCEDVPPLPPESVDDICRILEEEGVQFKVSSIHVNFWPGSFDKMTGVRRFLSEQTGCRSTPWRNSAVFIGDSPNDEPLFAAFPHSIAVGNLRRFLPRLSCLPEYITDADSADGFREAARVILSKRAAERRSS